MVQLQNSISKCLHHHTLFNMFSNMISKAHHVQILSCSSSRVNVLAYILINLPNLLIIFFNYFHNISNVLPHPLIASIPSTPWVSTFYVTFMATNKQEAMMQFAILLLPLHEMLASIWDENNSMRFLQPCSTLFVDKLTCYSRKMAFCTLVDVIIVDPM